MAACFNVTLRVRESGDTLPRQIHVLALIFCGLRRRLQERLGNRRAFGARPVLHANRDERCKSDGASWLGDEQPKG